MIELQGSAPRRLRLFSAPSAQLYGSSAAITMDRPPYPPPAPHPYPYPLAPPSHQPPTPVEHHRPPPPAYSQAQQPPSQYHQAPTQHQYHPGPARPPIQAPFAGPGAPQNPSSLLPPSHEPSESSDYESSNHHHSRSEHATPASAPDWMQPHPPPRHMERAARHRYDTPNGVPHGLPRPGPFPAPHYHHEPQQQHTSVMAHPEYPHPPPQGMYPNQDYGPASTSVGMDGVKKNSTRATQVRRLAVLTCSLLTQNRLANNVDDESRNATKASRASFAGKTNSLAITEIRHLQSQLILIQLTDTIVTASLC